MRNPVFYTAIAVAIYALMNVLQEQKFAKYTPAVCLAMYFSVMTPLFYSRWVFMRITDQQVAVPGREMIGWIIFFGIAYFLADWSYLTAYAKGADAFTVTNVMIALPLITLAIKVLWTGGLPTVRQIVGYVVTAVGIYIVAAGNARG